ncbi:unnamed protein product [Rotaria sordida]|uniref:Uncharacterized protein n=1 Tax=Rotaria sordida TaxID=392033 RepID=A0A816D807_9BILA|nr:unnamed protein product [Rotaria sordida]CAF1633765.1 unnamed protein product [Rotaria sordida]
MSSKTPDIIILNNKPSSSMTEEFSKLMITLPIHQQKIQLKLDSHCNEDADIIQNCLALHIGLSLVEFVLQECPQCAYWLKDHFLPSNHILFTTEVNPSNSQIDEMFNITQVERYGPPYGRNNGHRNTDRHSIKIDPYTVVMSQYTALC